MVVWEVLKHSVAIIKMLMLKLILVPVMYKIQRIQLMRPVLQEQKFIKYRWKGRLILLVKIIIPTRTVLHY
ncbi:Uncharacterised protein [Shigella sonnei]|nr:Uncharacterised protein [Shigella sonnei]